MTDVHCRLRALAERANVHGYLIEPIEEPRGARGPGESLVPSWRSVARSTLLIVACTAALAACPVPIGYTEATSGPVVGNVTWEDGRPAEGLDVAVASPADRKCATPMLRTRTD